DPIEITSYFDLAIDIHHIFPRAYCQRKDKNYPRAKWNSVINKAPLSSRTNRTIGGRAPSEYIAALEGGTHRIPPTRVDEILESHKITPLLLRNDQFELFIRDRACRLLDLISKAMGKTVTGRDSDEVIHAFGASLIATEPEASVA